MRKIVILLIMISISVCLIHNIQAQSFTKSLLHKHDLSFDVSHQHHFIDSSKFVIYLPSIYYGVSQQGPTLTDYITRDANGRLLIDPQAALPFAEDQNILQFGGRANGLGLGIQVNKQLTIAASYGIQSISHIDYPLQALNFYTAGNAFIFGEQLDLSFKMSSQAFHDYSFAANYNLGALTLGASMSFLSGITDATVEKNKLLIEAKPLFYNIITDTDFQINTTDLIRYEGLQDIYVDYSGDFARSFLSKNRGVSISFFGQYALDDKTSFMLKVNNIGSINWKSKPQNYSTSGVNSFDGVSILDILDPNKIVSYQDSLEQLLDIIESTNGYSTNLPLSFALSAEHHWNSSLVLTGAVHYTSFLEFNNYSAGIAAHYHLSSTFCFSGSLHHSTLHPLSVGLGAQLSLGLIDVFAHTNNLLSITNQIKAPYNYTSLGINIHFGK